jgi:peptidoglycan/LPS O-acetylase OafA/YrhL
VTTTRWSTLLAVVAVSMAVSWAALTVAIDVGASTPTPTWPVIVVVALLAVGVLAAAWPIRQWNAGRRGAPLNPLRAARTVALAKAAALTGAVMTGLLGGLALLALPRLDVAAQSERAAASGLAVLASVALLLAGVIAERWCRIPPVDDDAGTGGIRAPDGTAA